MQKVKRLGRALRGSRHPVRLCSKLVERIGLGASGDECRRFTDLLYEHTTSLEEGFKARLTEEEIDRLLTAFIHLTANVGFADHERGLRLFDIAQGMGYHFLRSHFYSVVPNTAELPHEVFARRFDSVDPRLPEQLALLERLGTYSYELDDVPDEVDPPRTFGWTNPAFYPYDAVILYAMVREMKPKRVIEVGCGYSTMLTARALARNGGGELVCVEPYPPSFLSGIEGVSEIIKKPVQEVPMNLYGRLGEGDLLFIDSTHVCRIGSDVNHLFLRVLPSLAPGVWAHVHDIYLPFEMPEKWVKQQKIFWNEQYVLQAFMACNSSFRPIMMNNFLGVEHSDAMRRAFPCVPKGMATGGGSYYMERFR